MPDQNYKNFDADDFLQDEFFLEWMRKDNPETNQWWANWIRKNAGQKNIIAGAERKYKLINSFKKYNVTDSEQKQVWQNITASINYPTKKVFKINSLRWVAAAAACLLLVVGMFVYKYQGNGTAYTVAAADKIKDVMLEDGTHIKLNKGARLTRYSKLNRQVWISGEGYFEVNKVKDASKKPVPFLVHCDKFEVKVTGTTFTVISKPNLKSVVLTEGKVFITNEKNTAEMKPGDRITLNNNRFSRTRVNTALYNAWKDQEFTFDNTSLADLKTLVNNVYGLEVSVVNEAALKHRLLNGTVSLSSETAFTKTIELLLNTRIVHEGNRLIITPKRQ